MNVMRPHVIRQVYASHLEVDSFDEQQAEEYLCAETGVDRLLCDPAEVERIEVNHGRLRGAIFKPKKLNCTLPGNHIYPPLPGKHPSHLCQVTILPTSAR